MGVIWALNLGCDSHMTDHHITRKTDIWKALMLSISLNQVTIHLIRQADWADRKSGLHGNKIKGIWQQKCQMPEIEIKNNTRHCLRSPFSFFLFVSQLPAFSSVRKKTSFCFAFTSKQLVCSSDSDFFVETTLWAAGLFPKMLFGVFRFSGVSETSSQLSEWTMLSSHRATCCVVLFP